MYSSDSFPSRYLSRVAATKSVLCAGLDLAIDHVPPTFRKNGAPWDIEEYAKAVIKIAAPKVPVVKFDVAFYGALGRVGVNGLRLLIEYAHEKGLLVILDAKRSGIRKAMEEYGNEVFGWYGADACTFVPYFGFTFDPAWITWLKQGRMVISMIRPSNPEAEIFHNLVLEKSGLKFYEYVAQQTAAENTKIADLTNGAGCVGGVVGATWSELAVRCREFTGDDVFLLIPAYGTQGGRADRAVRELLNSRGEPMGCVNSSSALTLYSWWDDAAKQPKQGDPLKLVEAAIDAANADLTSALECKLGKPAKEILALRSL